jgi:formylmethanofuran dehydrogenase subunit E
MTLHFVVGTIFVLLLLAGIAYRLYETHKAVVNAHVYAEVTKVDDAVKEEVAEVKAKLDAVIVTVATKVEHVVCSRCNTIVARYSKTVKGDVICANCDSAAYHAAQAAAKV